jgi:hypothetical protein
LQNPARQSSQYARASEEEQKVEPVKIFLKDEKKMINLQGQEEHLFEKLYLVIKDKVGTEFKPQLQ